MTASSGRVYAVLLAMLQLIGILVYSWHRLSGGVPKMLSQVIFSVLLIAGCLFVYEVGIWEKPAKHSKAPK